MATYGEKQKKANIYVYDMGTGNLKPESNYLATIKKSISRGWGLMRSKTYRESVDRGGLKAAKEVAESRKLVSHVEVNAGSVAAFFQVKVLVSDIYARVHASHHYLGKILTHGYRPHRPITRESSDPNSELGTVAD
ncbi:uncharacterized protein LOC111408567 [Olea europaea var. sylvestris]|uniref:uncharacterized protein LOC111408567 n=1 Tax=Olea europaea var. sylvestris TaxID=158386 RepID=UPI000C1CE2D5|nr:uncharacterized protein LOC111408567 [Olea europaea var. sylvestris]